MMRKKLRNFLAMLLVSSLFISNIEPITVSASGSDGKTMNTDELVFITLAENTDYRWNANGNGDKNNVIHLDTVKGSNCKFKLKKAVDKDGNVSDDDTNYYGIKFIRDAGTDRFTDIEDKSMSEGKKLHLWESDDKKVKGNEHRQFAFYLDHTDSNGNECYYIKNRNSGLWLGVEDTNENGKNDKGDKIIQTSASNRKLWIITKAVVPKCGDEAEDIIAEGQKSAFVEIFQKNTIHAINRESDAACKGTQLHPYDVGTSSKWRIDWNATYSAYTIHAVTGGEKDRGSLFTDGGVVWDVRGEDGKTVHLWTEQSKSENQNTSQLWRFIKQDEGVYKIQNARSGLYLNLDTGLYDKYVQSEKGMDFEISAYADQKDPINSVNFDYATNWMEKIPNDVSLSSVNIPGTHDTGTASIWQDDWAQFSWTSCQKLYYGEQLNVGARSFDIRCNALKDDASPSDVMIIHGNEDAQCGNRDDSNLTLQDILDDSVRFLKEHPSEALIMTVKQDAGSASGLVRAMSKFIKENKAYVYTGNGIPSMGEARGKMVFIRRYAIDKEVYNPADDRVDKSWLGLDLTNWDNNNYMKNTYAIQIYDKDNISVFVQDAFKAGAYTEKRDYIKGTMKQTVGENENAPKIPSDAWVYNYVSTAGIAGIEPPLMQTRGINPWLYKDEINCIDNRRLGMVMMNYIDAPMARLIYETNFKDGEFFATKTTLPTKVKVSYGKTLGEAEITCISSCGGKWRFDEEDYIPTWEDFENGRKFSMTYYSDKEKRQSQTAEVAITDFMKNNIAVTVDSKEITYGDTTPKLTFTCDERNLQGEDKTDDLKITLSIEPEATGKDGRLKAGTWKIQAVSDSDNYNVFFTEGTIKVNPKTVNATWSDTTNLKYNGEPQNVTAELTGVLGGDDCTPVVTGGDKVGPSWSGELGSKPEKYTATVSLGGADAGNYQLEPSSENKSYYILKEQPGEDEYKFPETAVLTYGQTLGDAILEGASGDGRFVFVNTGTKEIISDTMPDAGKYNDQYYLAFKPSDSTKGMVVNQTPTTVEVLKKDVKIKVQDAEITHADKCNNHFAGYDYDLVDGYSLVDDDTKENLGVTLTSTGKEESDVGTYPITLDSCTSTNYNVTAIPGTLTVNPWTVTVKWKNLAADTEMFVMPNFPFYYNGQPVNIGPVFETRDAEATQYLDSGDYKVIGTQGTDVGKYKLCVFFTNKNYKVSKADDSYGILEYEIKKSTPNVTFPTGVSITYGQTLSQAEFTGGDKKGYSGKFVVKDAASDETLRTVDDSGDVTVQFIPDDTRNYEVVSADVPLKVNPKKLTVKADNQKQTYGDDASELTLTWSMDESQLVGDDSIGDFAFTLKVGTEETTILDAGHHPISIALDSGNSNSATTNNYDIDCQEGYLEISPRVAKIQWSDTTCITVGDSAPSVSITNLVSEEDCKVTVKSDGTENASYDPNTKTWKPYTAKITGLSGADRFNYSLSAKEEDLEISYYVLADENDSVMPQEAYLTYGQKRSEVKWGAMAGKGTFQIVDRQTHFRMDDDTILSAGEYNDYAVMFYPASSEGVESDMVYSDITLYVEKKELTVNALPVEKTYGEETKLDFEVDASKLVGEDTKADLGVVLTAIGTSESEEENIDGNRINSPVGTYDITMAQCNSANYDVTVASSMLTIHPKEVTLSWSDVSNLVYSGKPVNVTTQAEGILEGDTCEVKVFNGQRIEAGTYRAIAVSLSNTNYTLPKLSESNLSKFVKEYTIKAIPNIDGLPTVAERVYNPNAALKDEDLIGGNVLDIKGESLAGTWSWKEQNTIPTVGNDGYEAVFTLSDEDLEYQYITITETIAVPMKKATPYISSGPVASAITYGQTLDASKLSGGTVVYGTGTGQAASEENAEDVGNTPVAGTFAWKDATTKPTVADSGKTTYTVVFTPEDSDNYETVEMDITLTVNEAEAEVNKPEAEPNKPVVGTIDTSDDKTAIYKVTTASLTKGTVAYVAPANKNIKTVSIPATVTIDGITYKVTSVAANAFANNKKITKVTIGSNISTVGKKAFYKCTKLKSVKFGKSVTSIGASALYGCSKLTTVSMGSKVTTIYDKTFYKCTSLKKITIPSKVKKIGKQAFYGCKKLKTITIKTTKLTGKNVGSKAFKGIYSKATIKVPKSKLKSYKKLLKAKGVSSKAKIKK